MLRTLLLAWVLAAILALILFTDFAIHAGPYGRFSVADLVQIAVVLGSGWLFYRLLSRFTPRRRGPARSLFNILWAIVALVLMMHWPSCVYELVHGP